MLNHIVLIGRLVADPELRITEKVGKSVCKFRLAVDSGFGDNKRTDFINIIAFGKTAELAAEYLSKGKMTAVEGRLQIRNYQTPENEKRTTTEVIANSVKFLSPKGETAGEPWPAAAEDDVLF